MSSSKQIQNIRVVFLRVEMNEIHLNEEQRGKVTESIPRMYFFFLPPFHSVSPASTAQASERANGSKKLLTALQLIYILSKSVFFNIQLELNESQKLNIEGLETNKNHLPYP